MKTAKTSDHIVIGWREWVLFPELNMGPVKAKIDTGARTSALHAFDIEFFERNGKKMVRFKVHPRQRDERYAVAAETEVIDMRYVKDSGGRETLRPVIRTQAKLGLNDWDIELTLTNRDAMGFRLLIGRQAVKRKFLVHPGRSYLASGAPKKKLTGKKSKSGKSASTKG